MALLQGILIVGISLTICALSWYRAQNHDYSSALILILILGFGLRLFTASDSFLHKWDERYHALVAKNMMDDPFKPMLYKHAILDYNYQDWAANHIWVHKQPVPLWTMMISLKLFGINEFTVRIPSVLLSSIFILIVYLLGKKLFSRKVGYIAAFLASIHGLTIELSAGRSATDHVDIHFMVFVAAAVLFSLYYHQTDRLIFNLIAAFFVGMAILSKWLPALIVIPIWILMGLLNKKSLKEMILPGLLFVVTISIITIPWQAYILSSFPLEAAWEYSYNRKHFLETLGEHSGSIYYYLTKIRIQYGELIYVPLLGLLFYLGKKRTHNLKLWILGIWIFVPMIFFSLAQTKMKGYLIFTSPAYFLLTAYTFCFLRFHLRNFKQPKLIYLLLALLILLPIRYTFERVKPFRFDDPIFDQKKMEFQSYPANSIVFNEKLYIEAMFYSNCIAVYPFNPNKEQINSLKEKGFELIIKGDE